MTQRPVAAGVAGVALPKSSRVSHRIGATQGSGKEMDPDGKDLVAAPERVGILRDLWGWG